MRNISETPNRWVIVKILNKDYKVFASWAEGYLDGDRWKMNSGINKVEQDEDFYYFIGYSGSCYKCHKKSYGVLGSFATNVLSDIIDMSNGKCEVMDNKDDWSEIVTE